MIPGWWRHLAQVIESYRPSYLQGGEGELECLPVLAFIDLPGPKCSGQGYTLGSKA